MKLAKQDDLSNSQFDIELIDAVQRAAKGNSHTTAPAAAILWPDKDEQWRMAIPALQKLMLNLFVLGPYEPEQRSGPAIWLKCAIAGLLPEVPFEGVPVVYLPGVSRADLRAIESCPRELQPLAELQYRGAFWSQANAKDWTISAFLSSKNGGLGLDLAQDKATQEALSQALQAGVLLSCNLDKLQGRPINAEWLQSLMAPNPIRDVLYWMNEPEAAQRQWGEVLWKVFAKRCVADFGFDPQADGVLVAADHLARGEGKWQAVSDLYRDSFTSFPGVFELLAKLQPPAQDLFPDESLLAGYPQVNESQEGALRYALLACAEMDVATARKAVISAEQEHGTRRQWLWSRMGRSPLAVALEHLVELAERTTALLPGTTPDELAARYQESGWQIDRAALQALAAVHSKADVEAVGTAVRALYLPWLNEISRRLQDAAKAAGGLPADQAKSDAVSTCTVFVDGLRYDVGVELKERLAAFGDTTLGAKWTSLPSVTASGKAWCSPVAAHIAGSAQDTEFQPRVQADGKPLSGYNFRKLLSTHGIQPLDKHETGEPQGHAWTEVGDLDHYGHEHGVRLARDLDTQLDLIVERIAELCDAGWKHIRVVTDHGWLLVPGGLPKSELPKHQAETRWGRCAVLKDSAHGTPLTFGWDWCKDVQVAYAPGVSSFIAGADYAHGGISLQECLVPVVHLTCSGAAATESSVTIEAVTWRGLRCNVVVAGAGAGMRVDIRTKAALVESSLAASIKAIDDGKASLAVVDDDREGTAALIVVVDENGEVVQKQATTIGEN